MSSKDIFLNNSPMHSFMGGVTVHIAPHPPSPLPMPGCCLLVRGVSENNIYDDSLISFIKYLLMLETYLPSEKYHIQ